MVIKPGPDHRKEGGNIGEIGYLGGIAGGERHRPKGIGNGVGADAVIRQPQGLPRIKGAPIPLDQKKNAGNQKGGQIKEHHRNIVIIIAPFVQHREQAIGGGGKDAKERADQLRTAHCQAAAAGGEYHTEKGEQNRRPF